MELAAAEVGELDGDLANGGSRLEHLALELTRQVPGRLPACGGVKREDEARSGLVSPR